MVEDKYNTDENDLEDFQDFEVYYGLENEEEDLKELIFDEIDKSVEDYPLEKDENEIEL